MFALVVDTSAHPKLLTLELCVTRITMNQFPHAQGLPLMSFGPLATLTTRVSPL